MWKQLNEMEKKYEELEQQLQDLQVIQKKELYSQLASQFAKIKPTVDSYKDYKQLKIDLIAHQKMAEEDAELSGLAKEEIQTIQSKIQNIETKLKNDFVSKAKNPLDKKNIILELRAGAGGEEAALFCRELFETYCRYASLKNWKTEILSCSPLATGGFREVIAKVSGGSVYALFQYESGVHRVQRIPKTESQGRVHTSTVTVAVLPEAEKTEVHIKPEDIRIDVCRSSGAGGQHVNTTDSAVRIIHQPSNITVYCQEEKSQHANKEKAFKILYARLSALEKEKQRKKSSQMRLQQIGTGERSEKIRTYNFPQSRVTDHRVAFSMRSLDRIMKGELDLIIQPLIQKEQDAFKE